MVGMAGWNLENRGDWIRTSDLLLPKQARYRATLRPETTFPSYYAQPISRNAGNNARNARPR